MNYNIKAFKELIDKYSDLLERLENPTELDLELIKKGIWLRETTNFQQNNCILCKEAVELMENSEVYNKHSSWNNTKCAYCLHSKGTRLRCITQDTYIALTYAITVADLQVGIKNRIDYLNEIINSYEPCENKGV